MASRSDIDDWRIKVEIYGDRIEEKYEILDPEMTIRRKPRMKVWQVQRLLDRGTFGEVRLEKNIEDGKLRAVKRIPITGKDLSNEDYKAELKALVEFSKPQFREAALFTEFYGWFKHGSDVYLAMEYIPLGNLENNIGSSGKVPETEARDITEQILSGLEIMHAESFAHRDLKPQNVLVLRGPPKWLIKLADFGLSKRLTESTVYKTIAGTERYMAPEILEYIDTESSSGKYTNAVDLWAVGCIVFRIITGGVPFSTPNLIKYCRGSSRFPSDPLHDAHIRRESACFSFIRRLLKAYPSERPSASQALGHSWIRSGSTTSVAQSILSFSDQQISRKSELSVAVTNYNTGTHDGLKSHLQASEYDLSHVESPPQPRSALDTNSSYPTNQWTIRRKLLPSLTGSSLRTLRGHKRWVWSVAFSPDGTMLASASADASLCLWDVATGDVLHRLKCELTGANTTQSWCWSVAFSPDSKKIAAGGEDKVVWLWDITNDFLSRKLEGHMEAVKSVAFSPGDSKLVASASNDKTIRIWSLATHDPGNRPQSQKDCQLQILQGHTGQVRSVAFSSDGKKVASGSEDESVRIWDIETGAILRTFNGYTDSPSSRHWFWSVAFLPGSSNVVAFASEDETIRICDTASGDTLQTLRGHTESVRSISFSPDGKLLASASEDESVRVWNLETGAAQMLKGHALWVTSVAFSPDGKLVASGSGDETIRFWDVKSIRFAHNN